MPTENLTMQISTFAIKKELPILEGMCDQIRSHGDEAEIRVIYAEKTNRKGYAVFRDPASVVYLEYEGKYKLGDII